MEGEWHGEMMLMGNGNVGEELLNTWVLVLSSQHEFRAHHLKIGFHGYDIMTMVMMVNAMQCITCLVNPR